MARKYRPSRSGLSAVSTCHSDRASELAASDKSSSNSSGGVRSKLTIDVDTVSPGLSGHLGSDIDVGWYIFRYLAVGDVLALAFFVDEDQTRSALLEASLCATVTAFFVFSEALLVAFQLVVTTQSTRSTRTNKGDRSEGICVRSPVLVDMADRNHLYSSEAFAVCYHLPLF